MSGGKEIRTKISSVKSTQKITRAMEMVAASKMRRAQERMHASRPYAEKIRSVISHVANASSEYPHPYLEERDEVKKVGFIIISTDRGLCGGLNVNMFKAVLKSMAAWREKGAEVELCLIGSKAGSFFRRMGGMITAETAHLGDAPSISDLIGTVKVMLDSYNDHRIDRLYVAYNRFVSTMAQTPQVEQLLPLIAEKDDTQKHHWDYIYEPDAKPVLDALLQRYIESLVYQGVVENGASEQAARMVAMKSASDNAGDLIDDLQLAYNKARQSAITQELSEIVAGAAAV